MTDTDTETTDAESGERADSTVAPATDGPTELEPDDTERADGEEAVISEGMQRYLYRGSFFALALFGLFAAVQFYLNASRTISLWVTADYRPLFQAAFNLAVVAACGLGLTMLVERFR